MPEVSEHPADLPVGTIYTSGAIALRRIVWIDGPDPGEVTQLMDAAADVVEQAS